MTASTKHQNSSSQQGPKVNYSCNNCEKPLQHKQDLCPKCFAGYAPVLRTWKPSMGLTLLGAFIRFTFFSLLFFGAFWNSDLRTFRAFGEIPEALSNLIQTSPLISIVLLFVAIASIIYAGSLYPSYFKGEPALKSNETISLLNGLFGGLIFGLRWNANLSDRFKGSTPIFSMTLNASFLFVSAWVLLAAIVQDTVLDNIILIALGVLFILALVLLPAGMAASSEWE